VVFLGPPGTGKTHLAIGLDVPACQAGHRTLFATVAEWVPASPRPTTLAGCRTS
jgi:DNA replication protein DnaC